jgi:hypothetical protein
VTSDRSDIGCPREKSLTTPCVARDGHLACATDGCCVSCGLDSDGIADEFAVVVRRYVELRSALRRSEPSR